MWFLVLRERMPHLTCLLIDLSLSDYSALPCALQIMHACPMNNTPASIATWTESWRGMRPLQPNSTRERFFSCLFFHFCVLYVLMFIKLFYCILYRANEKESESERVAGVRVWWARFLQFSECICCIWWSLMFSLSCWQKKTKVLLACY